MYLRNQENDYISNNRTPTIKKLNFQRGIKNEEFDKHGEINKEKKIQKNEEINKKIKPSKNDDLANGCPDNSIKQYDNNNLEKSKERSKSCFGNKVKHRKGVEDYKLNINIVK